MVFDAGSVLGGIYEITKVLSEAGGMSSGRYLVKNRMNNTYFAKVFDTFDPTFQQNGFTPDELDAVVDQYSNEYAVLEKVRCNGVPAVIKHFQEGCFSVVVSEYIPGKNLETMLTEKQRSSGKTVVFAQDEVIDYTLELCNILEYLHTPNQRENRKAIVNRDIKPANIILGEDGLIYLVDFGTAKIRNLVSTQQDTVVCKTMMSFGSPGYAPPEQHLPRVAEPTMDIYSLGATMFRLFSGELPMSVEERGAYASVGQDASLHNDSIDPALEKVIQKMTEIKVKDRYQSISEVRIALQKIKGQHKLFAQVKTPAVLLLNPFPGQGASLGAIAGPPNYGIIMPSGCPFAKDSVFYINPSDGSTHSNYASGLIEFTKVCSKDLSSRQLMMRVSKPGLFGLGTQSQDIAVPLTVAETYFAQLMQPDLLKYWRFTRSCIAYPENDVSRFKIATEYDALIEFLTKNTNHNEAGIPISKLPEKTYDKFPGIELFRSDSTYDFTQTKSEAVKNKALLVVTNNNPDLIEAMYDLTINYHNSKPNSNKISKAMGVYLLNNTSEPAQVRALGVGNGSWGNLSLDGSYSLSDGARFVRVAQVKKFP